MFNPSILTMYRFHRTQQVLNPIDACTDTAHGYGLKVSALALFLRTVGIDAEHLRNL